MFNSAVKDKYSHSNKIFVRPDKWILFLGKSNINWSLECLWMLYNWEYMPKT